MMLSTKAMIGSAVLAIVLLIGVGIGNAVGPNYVFQKAVHSHTLNAYYASTPELMRDQLQLAVDGMHQLGLNEGMYGKYLPWERTPEWRMDYEYLHMQAIIDRCAEVIDWRTHQDLTSGQVTDVYNQKMANLKNFIIEGGWSDDIAKGAFYVNFHVMYAFWFNAIFWSLIGISLASLLVVGLNNTVWSREEEAETPTQSHERRKQIE